MRYLLAFIAPDMRSRVVDALIAAHVPGLTMSEVQGFGQEHDAAHPEHQEYAGLEMTRKLRLEIFCHDQDMEKLLQAIYTSAHTGHRGDGKVFVLDVTDALRLKTGERGPSAIGLQRI
jgi:nitrogen regulatory protein PII